MDGGLARPVLRPLAEHLVSVARPREGDIILNSPCGSPALATVLRRICPSALVVALDGDRRVLAECAAAQLGIRVLCGDPARPPVARGSCDMAISLLTLPHTVDAVATLRAVLTTLRSGGRLVAAVWGERAAVPHLAALEATLRTALGHAPAHLEEALSLGVAGRLEHLAATAGLAEVRVACLRDVVRFEGVDHLWAALCATGPLAPAVTGLAVTRATAARADLAARLLPVTNNDGTLVIPVELALLIATAG